MNKEYKFSAEILASKDNRGAYVEFPYNVKDEFGKGGIIKVKATFNNYEYRGALANMGTGCHILGIRKDIRAAIGKDIGDIIEVTVIKDNESRAQVIPQLLSDKLNENPQAFEFFKGLTDSQKNKFINHITSAKKAETKQKRLAKVIDMLNSNQKMK